MSTADDLRAGMPQSGTAGNTDMVEVARPDGMGGYTSVLIPLSAIAQLLTGSVALSLTGGDTENLSPVGNVLIVPDLCRTAIVAGAPTIAEVRFASHVTDHVNPPDGTEIEIILTDGGTVFGGQTYAAGPASVVIRMLSGTWFVKSHS